MSANERAVQAKPLAMEQQMTLGLSIGPRASREGGDRLTEGEIDALDERGLDERAESHFA